MKVILKLSTLNGAVSFKISYHYLVNTQCRFFLRQFPLVLLFNKYQSGCFAQTVIPQNEISTPSLIVTLPRGTVSKFRGPGAKSNHYGNLQE